jgi:rhodanese-related sulfurtransferase
MADEVGTITKEELAKHLEDGSLVVIDVRINWDASQRKIKNAVRQDPHAVDDWKDHYDRSQPIVLYCSSPRDQTSREVAGRLQAAGFEHVRVLTGGWFVWKTAGLATQRRLKEPLPEGFVKDVIKD